MRPIRNVHFRRADLLEGHSKRIPGIGLLANRLPPTHERHFAFIFPASQFYVLPAALQ